MIQWSGQNTHSTLNPSRIKIETEKAVGVGRKTMPSKTRKLFKNTLNLHIYARTCDSMCLWQELSSWGDKKLFNWVIPISPTISFRIFSGLWNVPKHGENAQTEQMLTTSSLRDQSEIRWLTSRWRRVSRIQPGNRLESNEDRRRRRQTDAVLFARPGFE